MASFTTKSWRARGIKLGLIQCYRVSRIIRRSVTETKLTMLYDTYGEEYLTFLRELNEILSLNELAELDYL